MKITQTLSLGVKKNSRQTVNFNIPAMYTHTFAGLFWKEYDNPVAIGVASRVGLCGDKYIECLLDTLLGEAV
jgi:hypothetical protein